MARPLARFKDSSGQYFQAEWQPHVLSSLVNRVTRKNSENQTNIPITMSAREGLVNQETYFNKTVASSDLSNYTLLYQGEFAYNHSSSKGYDYGAIHRLTKLSCGAVTPLYFCFSIKDQANIDSDFLAYYFESQKWTREVASICSKGARQHGALNISVDDFFNIVIYAPPSIEEQRQIVNIASSIDNTINQMKSIVDAWELRKKGVAQKLFNQEVRFKNCNGQYYQAKWQSHVLSSLVNRVTRKNSENQANLPLTMSARDGLVDQESYFNKTVASSDLSNYTLLYQGEFAYNHSSSKGYDYGAIHRLTEFSCGAVTPVYFCFSIKDQANIDSNFLAYYFESQKWTREVASICSKGARQHGALNISADDFFNINIYAPPSIEEQHKIAECLGAIDDVIALSKAELEKWRELKKGLLQQLFV